MFWLRFVAASVAVLLLPGWLLIRLSVRDERPRWLEMIPYAFGGSLVMLTAAALLSFASHVSFAIAANVFLVVLAIMVGVTIWRARSSITAARIAWPFTGRVEGWHYLLGVVSLLVILVVGQAIEMPPPGQEDASSLVPAQRILRSPALFVDKIFYGPGDIVPYLIPVQSYAYALIARWGGLETVQVYFKLRVVLSLVVVATAYAMTLLLLPQKRGVGGIVLLVVGALIWNGWGTQYGPGVFGQFFPYTEYHDLSISVILPVALLLFLKGIAHGWRWLSLSLGVGITLLFVHPREAILMEMMGATIISVLVLLRERKTAVIPATVMLVLLALIGAVVTFSYSAFNPSTLTAFATSARGDAVRMMHERWQSSFVGLLYPPIDDPQFTSGADFLLHPIFLLTAFVLPILLAVVVNRQTVAALCVILVTLLLSTVPILTLLLISGTYGPFMFGAPATLGLFPISYVAFFLLLSHLVDSSAADLGNARLRSWKTSRLAISVIATLALALLFASWLYEKAPVVFYAWVFGGSLVVLVMKVARSSGAGAAAGLREPARHALLLPVGLMVAASIALGILPASGPKGGLWQAYRQAQRAPPVTDWERWYEKGPYEGLPWEMVQFIRREIPPHQVFLAPAYHCRPGSPPVLFYLPSLTNQFVYSTGSYISITETNSYARLEHLRGIHSGAVLFEDDNARRAFLIHRKPELLKYSKPLQIYGALISYYDEVVCKFQPVFNEAETLESGARVIAALNIDYILVPREWRADFERVFRSWLAPSLQNRTWWDIAGLLLLRTERPN
jgi:hypothetical protein